jgi:hypothetical protein
MAAITTRDDFARALLTELGLEPRQSKLVALVVWMQCEGSRATFNPLSSTLPMDGSTDFNSVGVQNYVSLEQGVKATAATLREDQPGYFEIRQALKHAHTARRIVKAVGNSAWGTSRGLMLDVLPQVKANYDLFATIAIGQT